jgi:hypothetical protein
VAPLEMRYTVDLEAIRAEINALCESERERVLVLATWLRALVDSEPRRAALALRLVGAEYAEIFDAPGRH